jgi:DNA-binding response OmpR family regulator
MPVKRKILIIEDDLHIAEGLQLNLGLQGFEASVAADGNAGLQQWKEWRPHLVILDIMLPGMDGLEVLKNIRLEDEQLPVLILSAKATMNDKIKGLSSGVDDYLTKPFNLEELILRVERLLTRASWLKESADLHPMGKIPSETRYSFGNNQIDFTTSTAQCQKGLINLTEQEIKLLQLFIANKGQPLSRQILLENGWGYSSEATSRTVDNFIVRFRKYFEEDPKRPRFFKSRRSLGYVFDDSE